MYRIIAIILAILMLGAGWYLSTRPKDTATTTNATSFDGKNATFIIESTEVTLTDGISEIETSESSADIVTEYFGNTAEGDLTGDGKTDIAFLVTQNPGGSGFFYYVVVAIKTDTGYKTTNAFYVGDRIAPQSTEIHSDSRELHVNYADRRDDEPMTAIPSQGKVLLLKVTPDGILEGLMK